MDKNASARHAQDYRERKKKKALALGIESVTLEVPLGVRSGLKTAMKDHGYSQVQELWQDLALSFLSMPHDEQGRRLRKPDTSAFVVTPKLARKLTEAGRKESGGSKD